ncbi:recombinase family protein [Rhizobium sp. NFR12]|uniref:recombinase family protein n=1 Tax=Rhizobium sp. NFR12 TaxID=1566261 RepID=UPI0008A7D740|nr:recombinase family protein [Rhizobium sp. NFR12]SEH23594.1 Resolvase, N terminal domain [Rhizobium sp. NFR12]
MVTYRMSKQAVAYIRVSTNQQGEVGIGLEAQRASIRTYADASGVEIVEWFQDVASGRGDENLARREGLNKALEFAQKNNVDLLVDSLDRLSRHTKTVEHILRERKVAIVSVSDERTSDPLVLASRAARAEYEGNQISERTRLVLDRKKAEGVKLGNRTNLPEAQKLGAESNKRRAEEKVNEIASTILQHSWQDLSVPALVNALNGLGLKTSRGKPWSAAALRKPHRAALEVLRTSTTTDYRRDPNFGRF